MKAPALIALFCVLGGTGSARSQEIYQKQDTFDGTTHNFTKNREARLEGGSFVSMRYIHLSLHASSPVSDPSGPYLLEVGTMTVERIFISAGGSLILKLDGAEMMALSGAGSLHSRQVFNDHALLENADYPLSQQELNHIAHAKSVDFRILGDRQNLTGSWKPDMIADAASVALKAPPLLVTRPPANSK